MITKGIIKSIDLLGNTCTVHIPFFETAGNDPIIETATVSNTPGSYNGYKVGDVVYVAFEDGSMSNPVVIGKLYLGTEAEKADPRGVLNVEESTTAKKATLPADASLSANLDSSVPNTTVPYSSLSSIANGLNKLNTDVAQNDRDYGNRFKQVISSIEDQGVEFTSKLEQTSQDITAEVNKKVSLESGAEVGTGLGWTINTDKWEIMAKDSVEVDSDNDGVKDSIEERSFPIFQVTREGVSVSGDLKLTGYSKETIITYTQTTSNTEKPKINPEDTDGYTWSAEIPAWREGYYIWQRTVVKAWDYNKELYNDLLQEYGVWEDTIVSDNIVCLAGTSAASYWLNCSSNFHAGDKQNTPITITAMYKVGTGIEQEDTSAILKYRWVGEEIWKTTTHILYIEAFEDKNLEIVVVHGEGENEVEFARETILYSPLNTPIVQLSPETATIAYSTNGTTPLETSVSSTGILYLNGANLGDSEELEYWWVLENCTASGAILEDIPNAVGGQTVSITSIDEDTESGSATCYIKVVSGQFAGEIYTKTFRIAKSKQGIQGISVVSQSTYYALINPIFYAGSIKAPASDDVLEVKSTDNHTLTILNLDGSNISEAQTVGEWSETPPEHTPDTTAQGWKYWTTVRTEYSEVVPLIGRNYEYSTPIINEDLSGVYELAQGKTTNYYSNLEPTRNALANTSVYVYKPNLKVDDCWFDTGFKEVSEEELATLDLASKYINYYVGEGNTKTRVTNTNYTDLNIIPKTTKAYKRGVLKQCISIDGNGNATWEDIGGELVANKITANYINALDITAKKIEVPGLFTADGLTDNPNVQIAGFNVESNTLTTGKAKDGNLIKINSDTNRNQYIVEPLAPEEENGIPLTQQPSVKFKQAQTLWVPSDNDTPHLTYHVSNDSFGKMVTNIPKFGVAKITFTENINTANPDGSYFNLYLNCTTDKGDPLDASSYGNTQKDYLIASKLNRISDGYINGESIPLLSTSGHAQPNGNTEGRKTTTALKVSYKEPISVGDYIYIVYSFSSGALGTTINGEDINYGASFYLPTDIRMTIGDNFQVLADGSIYASNLFLGGTIKESAIQGANAPLGSVSDVDNAAGQLAAVSASFNHLEVKDTKGNTLFKADGRTRDSERNIINDEDRVKIGGFSVTDTSLSAGTGNGHICLHAESDPLSYTPAEYIESNGSQYIDTGVKYSPSNIYVAEIEISYNTTTPANQICGFTANRGCGIGTTTTNWWLEGTSTNSTVNVNQIYKLKFIKGAKDQPDYFERWIDDTRVDYGTGGNTTITSNTFWLMATTDNSGAIPDCACQAKLYSCKIYENGNIIRNFIPVFKDGEYCLYDTCFGQYYKNENTNSKFNGSLDNTISSIININGNTYTRLEYIQNNGLDNYIDTGIMLDYGAGFTVETEFAPTQATGSAVSGIDSRLCLLSNWNGGGADDPSHLSLEILNHARLYCSNAQPDLSTNNYVNVNIKNKAIFTYANKTASVSLNNEAATSGTSNWTNTAGPSLYIFVDRVKRFGSNNTTYGSCFRVPWKLYSMKITSGATLVAHYLPVLNSSNVPGLVNLVDGTFLTNAAGAQFTYGGYALRTGNVFNGTGSDAVNSYRTVEYIESSGNRHIDTITEMNFATDAFEITVQPTVAEQGGIFFGYWDDTNKYAAGLYHTNLLNQQVSFWSYTDSGGNYTNELDTTPLTSYTDLAKHTYRMENMKLYVDGNYKGTHPSIDKKPGYVGYGIGIFGANGQYKNNNYTYRGRVYGCKIWNNGRLDRNLIPVIQNETTYGLYDTAYNKFYSGEGSGTFTGKGFAQEFTALYLGAVEPELAPFSVTNTGKLKATDATIQGHITATSGEIGGLTIKDNGLYNEAEKVYFGPGGIQIGENFSVTVGEGPKFTLSDDQKKEIIDGIEVPDAPYIGTDGYWYVDGQKTETLAQGPQGSSITVKSTGYKTGASGTTEPSGNWSSTVPSVTKGQYLWTRITFSDTSYYDTVTYYGQDGQTITGPAGRSVLSSVKYYTLATSTPDTPSNSTGSPTGWSTTPPSFESGKNYYETTRTYYNTADSNGHYYSWSTPVKNSMLTVDFINSLGITAKKIAVGTDPNYIFIADEFENNVNIGGWTVNTTYLGTGMVGNNGSAFLSPSGINGDSRGNGIFAAEKNNKTNWGITLGSTFGVDLTGKVYAQSGHIGGFNLNSTSLSTSEPTAEAETSPDYICLCSGDLLEGKSIASSKNKKDWRIIAGNNFGVDSSGILYASAGKIGNFTLTNGAFEAPINNPISSSVVVDYYSELKKGASPNCCKQTLKLEHRWTQDYFKIDSAGAIGIYTKIKKTLKTHNYECKPNCSGNHMGGAVVDGVEGITFLGDIITPDEPTQVSSIVEKVAINSEGITAPKISCENIALLSGTPILALKNTATSKWYGATLTCVINNNNTSHANLSLQFYETATKNNAIDLDTITVTFKVAHRSLNKDGSYTIVATDTLSGTTDTNGKATASRSKKLVNDGWWIFDTNVSINYVEASFNIAGGKHTIIWSTDDSKPNATYTTMSEAEFEKYAAASYALKPTINKALSIGTSTSNQLLNIYSQNVNGQTTTPSDLNLKNSITPLKESDKYEQLFDSLKPVTFKYNDGTSGRTHMGFIAQDLKIALEDAGFTTQDIAAYVEDIDSDGNINRGIRYSEFVSLNIHETQKLKKRVSELESQLEELKSKIK